MKYIYICVLLGALLPSRVHGQNSADPDSVKHRNDCRLAEQVLVTGHPKPHRDWALQIIGSCGLGAADAIAAAWKNPPSDTLNLSTLFLASSRYRDGQIYDAVMRVVQDRTRPDLVRVAALGVLASYAQPRVMVDLRRLVRVASGPFVWQNAFLRIGHELAKEGLVPLPQDVQSRVYHLVNDLASDPPGSPVRDSAFHLKYLLGFR